MRTTADVLAAPLGAVVTGRLVITRGPHTSPRGGRLHGDLYRARFDGKVPTSRYREAPSPSGTAPPCIPRAVRSPCRVGPVGNQGAHVMSDVVADLEALAAHRLRDLRGTSKITVKMPRPGTPSGFGSARAPATSSWSGRPASLSGSASGAAPRRWPSTTPASTLPAARPTAKPRMRRGPGPLRHRDRCGASKVTVRT